MKLFNRVYKFINYTNIAAGGRNILLFEIPFCDAEVIFGSSENNTNLAFEIVTDDKNAAPIRIVSIEFFGQSKKDFSYKEKMKKLEKINAERIRQSA
jgi:hypothetical protein